MGLVLRKNFVLTPPDNSFRLTVVKVYQRAQVVVLCEQDWKNPKKPFKHRISEPFRGFPFNAFHSDLGVFDTDTRFENIKPKHLEKVERDRAIIAPVVEDKEMEERFFQGQVSKNELNKLARKQGCHIATMYRLLGRFYAFGQFNESLLPFWSNIGLNRTVPKDYIEAAQRFPKGVGAGKDSGNIYRRRHNQVDRENVQAFIKGVFRKANYKSWAFLHSLYLSKYVINKVTRDGEVDYEIDPYLYLTDNQFRTIMGKFLSETERKRLKRGSKDYRNNDSAITGSVMDITTGPTSRYEIDATILDVYIISKVTKKKILVVGRPILYIVVDASSTAIAGYYLSVNTQKYESVLLAIFNAMTDKTEHCARYGVHLSPNDWPIHHLCNEVAIDNGTEYTLAGISQLIESRLVKVGVDVAEAYMGKSKGSSEGIFNILAQHNIYSLRGSVQKNRAKAKKHPSTSAIFTLDDINEIIIKGILMHNHTADVPNKLTQESMLSGVKPNPINVFNWGIENLMDGGMTLPAPEIMRRLLPRYEAKVTKRGVRIKVGKQSLLYIEENETFREWREEVSHTGGAKINVIVNPNSTSYIWYSGAVTQNQLIRLRLSSNQARMNNLSMVETLDALTAESVFRSENKVRKSLFRAILTAEAEETQKRNMRLLKDVQKIPGKSMPKNVRENREVEQELEMMEMSLKINDFMSMAMNQSHDGNDVGGLNG